MPLDPTGLDVWSLSGYLGYCLVTALSTFELSSARKAYLVLYSACYGRFFFFNSTLLYGVYPGCRNRVWRRRRCGDGVAGGGEGSGGDGGDGGDGGGCGRLVGKWNLRRKAVAARVRHT